MAIVLEVKECSNSHHVLKFSIEELGSIIETETLYIITLYKGFDATCNIMQWKYINANSI